VSKWNGTIDWDKVKNAGVQFAIVRAGYRGSVTGSLVEEIATSGKAGRRQRTSGRRTVELMPIRSRAVQPEKTSDRLDREVFSTENATPEKAEGKAITERPEDPARVTEEELQALLQELLTV
jgi:hypothetical protein